MRKLTEDFTMRRRLLASIATLTVILMASPLTRAQVGHDNTIGAVYDRDVKGQKSGAPPRHTLAGIWEPAKGGQAGVQGKGAMSMDSCRRDKTTGKYAYDAKAQVTDTGYANPDCLRPEVEPPYTPLGLETLKSHRPGEGYRMVPEPLNNDPQQRCDPGGFPRILLYNFRTSQILENPEQIVILYENQHRYRVIWTDGRELPKDPENPHWSTKDAAPPESRWWGYSVGKWADDYTFVVETNGLNDKTWLDTAGLPHSDALQVEETYHRVDADHLEMTVKVTDPKMYTKPWVAMDKLSLRLQAPHLDIEEYECSPTELEHYHKIFGDQAGFPPGEGK